MAPASSKEFLDIQATAECGFTLKLVRHMIKTYKQNKGFQRSIYWNEYKTKEINENADANVFKYINLDPSFQGVNRLFVMAYNRANGQPTRNGQQKYYLPRISLNKYNVIIDGRNFYDNTIESDIEKYRELKKVMIGKREDYTTGSLLDFNYFNKHIN